MLHDPVWVTHQDQKFSLPRFWTHAGARPQETSLYQSSLSVTCFFVSPPVSGHFMIRQNIIQFNV